MICQHAMRPEFVTQAEGYSERSSESTFDSDVLAQQDDSLIPAHLFAKGFAESFDDGNLSTFSFKLGHGSSERLRTAEFSYS